MQVADPPAILAPAPSAEPSPPPGVSAVPAAPAGSAAPAAPIPLAVAPAEPEDDPHGPAVEIGLGGFFMVGGGSGSYAGASPFLVIDFNEGVFFRPSLALGTSLATHVASTFGAIRADTCLRLPGRYASHNGMQLDLCGGPSVGFSYLSAGPEPGAPATSQTLPYVDIGPSVGLRADADRLAFGLRALAGFNVARGTFTDNTGTSVDVSPLTVRLEVTISWDVQAPRTAAPQVGVGSLAH
jgi:hypothetical protein